MPSKGFKEETREVFAYIDLHNKEGVTPEELWKAGLFGRKGDAASWLSRWKGKGFLTTTASRERNQEKYEGLRRTSCYHTVTDGTRYDWSWAYSHGFRMHKGVLEQRDREDPRPYDKTRHFDRRLELRID